MIIVCNGVDGVFCFRNGEGDIVFWWCGFHRCGCGASNGVEMSESFSC